MPMPPQIVVVKLRLILLLLCIILSLCFQPVGGIGGISTFKPRVTPSIHTPIISTPPPIVGDTHQPGHLPSHLPGRQPGHLPTAAAPTAPPPAAATAAAAAAVEYSTDHSHGVEHEHDHLQQGQGRGWQGQGQQEQEEQQQQKSGTNSYPPPSYPPPSPKGGERESTDSRQLTPDPARVYDAANFRYLNTDEVWLEVGLTHIYANDWSTVEATYARFIDPVVFLSLPVQSGGVYEVAPISFRIKNSMLTENNVGGSPSSGTSGNSTTFSFETKSLSVNDSYCTHLERYTPIELKIPTVFAAWMVVERGFFNVSSHLFGINKDVITRTNRDETDFRNQIKSRMVFGCSIDDANNRCGWDKNFDTNKLANIAQLQTTRIERFLQIRGFNINRKAVVFFLVPHASAHPLNYLIPLPGEDYAYMIFEKDVSLACTENLLLKTFRPSITSTAFRLAYGYSFELPPGVFSTLQSTIGLDAAWTRAGRVSMKLYSILLYIV
jgi:hypothetical protein